MINKRLGLIIFGIVGVVAFIGAYAFSSFPSSSGLLTTTSNYQVPQGAGTTTPADTDPKTQPCPLNGQLY